MIRALFAIVALSLTASAASATPVCKTGVLCGNSCISRDKVCHKTTTASKPAPVAAAAQPMPPAAAAPAAKPTRCKTAKGKFAKCGTPGALPVT
jgi:hypothetical protein